MHFSPDYLDLMGEDELDDTLNWCRCAEKKARRQGWYGLASFWGRLGHEVIEALTRRWARERAEQSDQLYLPDARDFPEHSSPSV